MQVKVEKLVTWLQAASRAAKSSASRSTVKEIEDLWTKEAAEIEAYILWLKTGQTDLVSAPQPKK